MHKHTLRELAKFASGLIMGDFIFGLWLYQQGLPSVFFGIPFSEQAIVGWLVFDVLLFAYLVHYGWRAGERPSSTRERKFLLLGGTVFTLVALLHLSRIFFGWDFVIGSWAAPYWLNGVGAVITAFLAYTSFHFAKRR
jgi:hypothetical protein